jgi:hypothetical protein
VTVISGVIQFGCAAWLAETISSQERNGARPHAVFAKI